MFNIGFRCAKSPKRKAEYHWVYLDEENKASITVEDEYREGSDWDLDDAEDIDETETVESSDEYISEVFYDEEGRKSVRKKKLVEKKRTRYSAEL